MQLKGEYRDLEEFCARNTAGRRQELKRKRREEDRELELLNLEDRD